MRRRNPIFQKALRQLAWEHDWQCNHDEKIQQPDGPISPGTTMERVAAIVEDDAEATIEEVRELYETLKAWREESKLAKCEPKGIAV